MRLREAFGDLIVLVTISVQFRPFLVIFGPKLDVSVNRRVLSSNCWTF